MRALVVLLAACGAAPAPSPKIEQHTEPAAASTWIYRTLGLGLQRPGAMRATFELRLAPDAATLTETYERAKGPLTIVTADRSAQWTPAHAATYRGTRREVAGAIELDLAAPDVQPLHLRCAAKTVQVAAAGAQLACSNNGAFDPPDLTPTRALICGEAMQPAAGEDDDDRLVFGPPPGIEAVDEHDDCELRGLRLAR
jgi:hypothetical protein